MKKFLLKLGIVVLFVGIAAYAVYFILYPHPVSVIYHQHDRLARVQSPKFIFSGGSNALFGIDSARIEQKLDMGVVDYAIQAGVPLTFYIHEISPYIGKGDIIALVLEYKYYYGVETEDSISSLIETYPQGISSLLPEYWQNIPAYLKNIFQSQYYRFQKAGENKKESLNNYNEYGDAVYMLDYHGDIFQDDKNGYIGPVDEIDPAIIRQINDFSSYAKTKGATVVVFFPSMRQSQYDPQAKNGKALYKFLKQNLTCPVLGTPEEYTYPDKYITNTSYHLNREGRRLRTDQMIAEIRQAKLGGQ
jgi:hypothetical protein